MIAVSYEKGFSLLKLFIAHKAITVIDYYHILFMMFEVKAGAQCYLIQGCIGVCHGVCPNVC